MAEHSPAGSPSFRAFRPHKLLQFVIGLNAIRFAQLPLCSPLFAQLKEYWLLCNRTNLQPQTLFDLSALPRSTR